VGKTRRTWLGGFRLFYRLFVVHVMRDGAVFRGQC